MKNFMIPSLLIAMPYLAQANEDWGIWVSNTYQTDFGGSNYLAFLEIQPRTKNDNENLQQLIVRPLLGYKVTKELSLWLGYTWQGEYTPSRSDKFGNATNDIMQQVQWVHDINEHWNFQYRGRLEERLFADSNNVGLRMRHRFRLTYTIPDTSVFLIGFDEFFHYLTDINDGSPREGQVQSGVNQNRTYAGLGYKFNKHISADTGYQLQYVNNYGKEDLFNHVWLTNINVKF
ncbi:MAG: DUF2490 domain-containing protein [Gammaproteobacteria bacterium]|nr:DUF2490 domain-containing protein [Gammaproteobacteria bacterium]